MSLTCDAPELHDDKVPLPAGKKMSPPLCYPKQENKILIGRKCLIQQGLSLSVVITIHLDGWMDEREERVDHLTRVQY